MAYALIKLAIKTLRLEKVQKTNVAVTVFLVFIEVASLFTVLAFIPFTFTIPATGTLSSALAPPIPSAGYQDNATHQFIIRGPWIGDQKSAADVDAFVDANPYGTGVMLADGSFDIVNVLSYTSWNASATWVPDLGGYPGWTMSYPQLQAVINRFHYYGWKVILISATQIVDSYGQDPWSWYYFTVEHPELIAVNALGQTYENVSSSDQDNYDSLRVNFFANYTTSDTRFGISVGQRLIDVYCQRLSRMISDGSFVWDGWVGVDGWTGLTNDGMYWVMNNPSSYSVYGTSIGTTYPDQWYFGDEQSLNEWGNSSYGSLIPAGSFQSALGNFGNSAYDYSTLAIDSSHVYADRFQATNSGNVTSISVHTGGGSCQVSVYSDNNGAPNTLLGDGSGALTNGAYTAITLTKQAVVTSGSYYWLAIQPSGGTSIAYNSAVSSVWSANGTNTYGTYPTTFPSPTYGNCDMDIYATISKYSNWTSMSTVSKSYWIQGNANVQWWQYWQMRFAQMFAQINAVFNQRPSDYRFGTMIATDLSSAISGSGINCPVGMVNMTAFAKYDSFNHCEASDEETYNNETKDNAYAVGLSTYGLSSQVPDIHTIIEVDIDNWGQAYPESMGKQKYLSAAQSYVWVNGTRYRGCDPDWVVLFMANTKAQQAQEADLCPWIISVANILTSATPTYLGPVLDIPLVVSIWTDAFTTNYQFAQFAQDLNLNSSGFSQSMGTVYLDASGYTSSTLSASASTQLLQMFANGSINIIYGGVATQWSNIFMGNNESQAESTFKLTSQGSGSLKSATTLPLSQVTNAIGQWILGNTFNETYNSLNNAGKYKNNTGFIPLIQYNDGWTYMGIYYNSTSGRFMYTNTINPASGTTVDQGVLNRAINWASNDPITINDSLAEAKIFTLPNGNIAISIMNFDTYDASLPITMNLTGLNLPTETYTATWLSSGSSVLFADPSNVQTTLNGGADVLVISSKHS